MKTKQFPAAFNPDLFTPVSPDVNKLPMMSPAGSVGLNFYLPDEYAPSVIYYLKITFYSIYKLQLCGKIPHIRFVVRLLVPRIYGT
jgi:hypothetical protein